MHCILLRIKRVQEVVRFGYVQITVNREASITPNRILGEDMHRSVQYLIATVTVSLDSINAVIGA